MSAKSKPKKSAIKSAFKSPKPPVEVPPEEESPIKKRRAERRAARFQIFPESLYSFEEAGHALDLSRSRVFNLVSIGVISTVKLPGCDRKIPGHEIMRLAKVPQSQSSARAVESANLSAI